MFEGDLDVSGIHIAHYHGNDDDDGNDVGGNDGVQVALSMTTIMQRFTVSDS